MVLLRQLPIFQDNYVYLRVRDVDDGPRAVVVDPGDAGPVIELLNTNRWALQAIVLTHHHPDHTGGVDALREATGAAVVGAARDQHRLPRLDHAISLDIGQQATVDVDGEPWTVFDVAAHTTGHIAWAPPGVADTVICQTHDGAPTVAPWLAGRPLRFTGDSLFAGGCGRLFEGTGEDLARVMARYAADDADALICCAHEYTRSNLAFAVAELADTPHADAVAARFAALADLRARQGSSVPSTLGEERATNPFLLAVLDAAQQGATRAEIAQRVFEVRKRKDSFRG